MKQLLHKFGISEENTYYLENATSQSAIQIYKDIVKKLMVGRGSDPPQEFLIIHNFSGNST